jgi:peptide/nickel transport system substrate-binding protein
MKTRAVWITFATAATLALAAAATAQTPNTALTVALANDPTSLFMPRAADRTASNAAWSLYDSLVWVNDDGDIVPALATKWDASSDGKSYTFTLRRGVTFHNGEAFDAQSVVATWETGKDPKNGYADLYKAVTDIKVVDPFTVTMTLAKPDALFLTNIANAWAMVPPRYIRSVGIDAFAQKPVGTGPFRFVERRSGDRIIMDANRQYWDRGMPKVSRVTYRVIPDLNTRAAAVRTGEIDIANRLTTEVAASLRNQARVSVISYPNDRVYYVGFKNIGVDKDSPLNDKRVRQALNLAVNRPGIVRGIFGGAANQVSGFLVQGNLGFDANLKPYPYDVERAKKLLADAGFEKGFSTSMGCPTDAYTNINEVCLSVQRDLEKIGVDVSLEFKTSNTFWSKANYGAVGAMFVDSWSSAVGEALPRLAGALIPENFYAGWNDPEIVKQVGAISATMDRKARAALYTKLAQYMYDNPPFIYLYQPVIFEAVSSRVQNYKPRSAEEYYLKNVSVR